MNHDTYLRAILRDKKIRTIDLAGKMGIDQSTLNRKIQGKVKFSDKDIGILTEILNMTYEEIFKPNKVDVNDKSIREPKVYKVTISNIISNKVKCDSVIMPDGTEKKLSSSTTTKVLELLENEKEVI
jgi:transcriptional regulator with XRE-family HTH domain